MITDGLLCIGQSVILGVESPYIAILVDTVLVDKSHAALNWSRTERSTAIVLYAIR